MHIAFLTPEFPHPKVVHAAGIGTSIRNLAIELAKERVTVTVFVYGQKTNELIVENGIRIHLIKSKKYKFLGWYLHRKYIQDYCKSVIKKEKIELLEAPDWTGITAFMKFEIPLIIRFHGSDTYFCHLEKRKQKRKNFWFENLALKNANAFIAPTDFAGKLTNKLFKNKKIETKTIPNGIDLSLFRNGFPEKYEENTLLYVGTLIRKKGVLELPGIFNEVRKTIPNAKLILIGSDSFDIQTSSKSTWDLMEKNFDPEDLKNVSYLGKIPYEEVQKHIKLANVCVFPTYAETLGMVTIECMAMQKAVVNSNIGWSQELIVDHESGFLIYPANHFEFASKIIELFKNNDLVLEIGKKARLRAEDKFDIEKIAKNNVEFYSRIINSNFVRQ